MPAFGHVPDEAQAVHGPAADAVDGGDHQGVPGLQTFLEAPQGLAVAPGARADLGDDLVDAVLLELLGLGLQVALVLGGLADPGEADGEGKAVDDGPPRLVCSESWGQLMARKPFCQGFPQGCGVAGGETFRGSPESAAESARFPQNADGAATRAGSCPRG